MFPVICAMCVSFLLVCVGSKLSTWNWQRSLVKNGMADWKPDLVGRPIFHLKHWLPDECERHRRDNEYFREEVDRLHAEVKSLKSAKKTGDKQC